MASETLAPMESERKKRRIFGWVDTPWTVAALLGAWGVMIGIEEFSLANVFMVLAGLSCTFRLAMDCFTNRRRGYVPFILWAAVIISIVGVDIRLTKKKRELSEQRAGETERLRGSVGVLTDRVQKQSQELHDAQIYTDQHVQDIQDENRRLRGSIDKKDKALVKIAQDQYALNFFPQVIVTTNGSTESLAIMNNGKTNIETDRLVIDHHDVGDLLTVQTIAPQGTSSYTLNERGKARLLALGQPKVQLDSELYLTTLDKRKYKMSFTIVYEFKDGKIDKSYAVDGPITPDAH